jgi:very-short-patch-repair endonuclease
VHQKIDAAFREIEQAWGRCESRIEVAMLFALPIVARELGWAVIFKSGQQKDGDRDDFLPDILTIQSQAQLGEHRVDFLLTFKTFGPDFDRHVKASNGQTIPGVKEVEKKMIIECDGHDYHERTKDQARKDRSRDRFLQSMGYLVFRYTGSEIWQDVFRCAHEALTTLSLEANKDIFGATA